MPKKSKHSVERKTKAAPKPTPDDIDDPKLGLLRFTYHINPELDEYEGNIELNGRSVELRFYSDEKLDLAPTIKRTRELVHRHNAIMKRADKYLIARILPHYNDVWRMEAEPAMKKAELLDRVRLDEITVHADGRATYWYAAGDLFAGHGMQLFLSAETEFTDHDLPG